MNHGCRDTSSSITQTPQLAAEEQEEPTGGAHGPQGRLPPPPLPPLAACGTGLAPGSCPGTGRVLSACLHSHNERPGSALRLDSPACSTGGDGQD